MNIRKRQKLEELYVELLWRKYAENPAMFFRDCIYIPAGEMFGGTSGKTNFELFDYQEETLSTIRDNRYVIVLKARQLGLTTLMMAYAFWMLLFRPGSNIVLVSRSQTAANNALELVDFMYNFLPKWAKLRGPSVESDASTHHSYRFKDGLVSKVTSYAATRTVAAGQTATLVLWDEAALAEYQEDALRTLLPTTDAGGSMVIFSTARGGYNAFAKLYKDAERLESQFVTVFHPWHSSRFMNPLADSGGISYETYESKKRDMSSEPWRFYAEYPSSSEEAFRQSGRSRFANLPDIEEFEEFPLRGSLDVDHNGFVLFKEDENGPLRIREEALSGVDLGCKAVVSVDPSSGTGGDYTVITAGWVDLEGVPQRMAYWRSNMVEPAEYAEQAYFMGQFFADQNGKQAVMAVERQGGYGETVIHVLRSMGYKNLYVHKYTGHRKYRQDSAYGFPMTPSKRPLVVDSLAKWLNFDENMVMGGIDPELRRELGAFVVKEDGKVAADVGMHDDLVMSTAIWLYVAEENPPRATNEPIVDVGPNVQTFSVEHIWQEAEAGWRSQERESRESYRRMRRSLAWR
jgi:hypothetical protein